MPILLNKRNKNKNKNPVSEELEREESLVKTKDSSKVVIIFFILGISLLLSIAANFSLVFLSLHLGTREKIFVMRGGKQEIADEKDPHFRSDELIEVTVKDWIYQTYAWNSSILDSEDPKSTTRDPGVQIAGKEGGYFKVPTKSYCASHLLEIGFRTKFLQGLSVLVPSTFYRGETKSVIDIYFVGNTQRIESNLYAVEVIYTRTDLENDVETDQVKNHQIIFLQATEPYKAGEEEDNSDLCSGGIEDLLNNGLNIYKISPKISQ